MLQSKEERQQHIDLTQQCKERGGKSTQHRGVLAQYLDTPIPMGRVAILAHACNNENCSNPQHLYWATDRENIVEDGNEFGTWESPWDRKVKKHGYKKACELNKRGDKAAGGRANKGKTISAETRKKISAGVKRRNAERNMGR